MTASIHSTSRQHCVASFHSIGNYFFDSASIHSSRRQRHRPHRFTPPATTSSIHSTNNDLIDSLQHLWPYQPNSRNYSLSEDSDPLPGLVFTILMKYIFGWQQVPSLYLWLMLL